MRRTSDRGPSVRSPGPSIELPILTAKQECQGAPSDSGQLRCESTMKVSMSGSGRQPTPSHPPATLTSRGSRLSPSPSDQMCQPSSPVKLEQSKVTSATPPTSQGTPPAAPSGARLPTRRMRRAAGSLRPPASSATDGGRQSGQSKAVITKSASAPAARGCQTLPVSNNLHLSKSSLYLLKQQPAQGLTIQPTSKPKSSTCSSAITCQCNDSYPGYLASDVFQLASHSRDINSTTSWKQGQAKVRLDALCIIN